MKSKLQSLQLHGIAQDLLGRVNAMTALIGVDRDEWVAVVLEDEVKELEAVQADAKRKWQARMNQRKKSTGPAEERK